MDIRKIGYGLFRMFVEYSMFGIVALLPILTCISAVLRILQ